MKISHWVVYQYANGFFVEETIGRGKTRMFGPFVNARVLEDFLTSRRTR